MSFGSTSASWNSAKKSRKKRSSSFPRKREPRSCKKGTGPPPSRGRLLQTSSGGQRHAGLFVLAGAHVLALEDVALADPLEGLLEHFLRVGLEDDALARTPAARVDHRDEA